MPHVAIVVGSPPKRWPQPGDVWTRRTATGVLLFTVKLAGETWVTGRYHHTGKERRLLRPWFDRGYQFVRAFSDGDCSGCGHLKSECECLLAVQA